MIFFNPSLMPTPQSALLFMVDNPIPLDNYEDHKAALYIQLHELIIESTRAGENPITLIEEYLEVYYNEGDTTEEIAAFLIDQEKMIQALSLLQSSWKTYSPDAQSSSVAYGGMSQKVYLEQYATLTLRSYLETLSVMQYEYHR